jgi:methylglyoxal synthase
MKQPLLHFVASHLDFFSTMNVVTTKSTGRVLEQSLGLRVKVKVSSGPLGGDQEIGALVTRKDCGAAFLFIDPLSTHPHEADIHALTRICNVHNVPCATNPSTAEALIYALDNDKHLREHLHPAAQQKDSHAVEAYKQKQQQVITDTTLSSCLLRATSPAKT